MGGQIRRGHTETMNAAIWLSDLRGFTALSDRLPAETIVDILNRLFRLPGGYRYPAPMAVKFRKYMGDGLLAVFPIDEYVGDDQKVCSRVLEAARESRASVADHAISDWRCRRTSPLGRRSRMSDASSTAISAAATGSTRPASGRPSTSPRGWKRSPARLQPHRGGVGRVCRHLPGRLERPWRVSGGRLFQGARVYGLV